MARSKTLAIALASGALLACNAIIGLSDFEKRECAGTEPCAYDGGTDGADSGDVIKFDSGTDANPDAPPGVGPVSWAAFQMPNERSDSGIANAPAPSLDYDLSVPDIATDNVTHLVWRRKVVGMNALGDDLLLDEAQAACAKITPDKWRLPKRIELVTLLSHGQGAPYVDTEIFSVPADVVWTSSEVRTANGVIADQYWVVDFKTGDLLQQSAKAAGGGAKALCVKDKT